MRIYSAAQIGVILALATPLGCAKVGKPAAGNCQLRTHTESVEAPTDIVPPQEYWLTEPAVDSAPVMLSFRFEELEDTGTWWRESYDVDDDGIDCSEVEVPPDQYYADAAARIELRDGVTLGHTSVYVLEGKTLARLTLALEIEHDSNSDLVDWFANHYGWPLRSAQLDVWVPLDGGSGNYSLGFELEDDGPGYWIDGGDVLSSGSP